MKNKCRIRLGYKLKQQVSTRLIDGEKNEENYKKQMGGKNAGNLNGYKIKL